MFVVVALECSTFVLVKSRTSVMASEEKVLPVFKNILHCVNQPPDLCDLKPLLNS